MSIKTILKSLIIISTIVFNLNGANIIFDLGGVLIETNPLSVWWHTGPHHWLRYIGVLNSPRSIRSTLYNFLHELSPSHKHNSLVYDAHGIPLPSIMCDWLAGECDGYEISKYIDFVLNHTNHFDHYFANHAEQKLIHSIMHMMFTPKKFAKTCRLIESGVQFVKECITQGHKVYILSNWDPHSFKYLKKAHPQFFDLFDGKIISGKARYNKPHKKIYRHLLKKYKLKPRECIFIDDQPENVQAAQKLKIHGILCHKKRTLFSTKPNFDSIRTEVNDYCATNKLVCAA